MIKRPFYFELSSTTTNPCTMDKLFRDEAGRTWLCTGCGNPRGEGITDIVIQEEKPENTPLNMVSGCTVGIAQKDFLFSFGEKLVRQYLYLGRVLGPDRRTLENWVTFVGRNRIIVRGTRNASVRRCSECGRSAYFALGEFYLYPAPPEDVPILDAGSGGLVVSDKIVRIHDLDGWRQLGCRKLCVQDTPKDGLGTLNTL
jgi:hypothetical protein